MGMTCPRVAQKNYLQCSITYNSTTMKYKEPLDHYDRLPEDMTAYLRHYGWHFSKRLSDWAAKKMTKDGEPINPMSKAQVDEILESYGVKLKNDDGYDSVYVANMAKADFYGSSIVDDAHLALYVKDTVDDEDQADGFILNRFYADCVRKGCAIPWEDVI